MWPDGYYYQRYMFYCSKWTKEMEKTFVKKVLDHAKNGQFRPGCENKIAIASFILEVMKRHGGIVDVDWGKYMVKLLRERYDVFSKLVNRRDVVWNKRLMFVTALDATWKEFAKESRIGKCYINAYEDLWDELCQLFAEPIDSDSGTLEVQADETKEIVSLHDNALVVVEKTNSDDEKSSDHFPCGYVSDSSSSLWNLMDDFSNSDSDADSILPPLCIPSTGTKKKMVSFDSSPSAKSESPVSSSASNVTPLKKGG